MTPSHLLVLSSGWHPRKMFQSADLGTIQNPSNWQALFQQSTGVTAGAAGSVVGLFFDERYSLARGGEVAVNGSFDSDASWTKGSGWSISGGKAEHAAGVGAGTISQAYAGLGTKTWEITLVVDATNGNLDVRLTGGTSVIGPTISTTGTHTCRLTANGGNTAIGIAVSTIASTATIDSISVREVLGSHAIQETAGARPTLAAGGKIDYDGVDDSLVITFPSDMGSNCTVARAVPNGEATILTGQTITTTYTDSTDHCGLVIINRALTATETNQLRRWLNRRAG